MPQPLSFSFPARLCTTDDRRIPRNLTRSWPLLCGAAANLLLVGSNSAFAAPFARDASNTTAMADLFAAFVTDASQRFGIPASWIRAVIQAESFGDARALSPKGAIGLMQIMPETWFRFASSLRSGANLLISAEN